MKADEAVAKLRERLATVADDIVAVYLFGSVARNEAGPRSDVDVAVLCATAPPATLAGMKLDLADELEAVLGRRVDRAVVRDVVEHRLDDLLGFVESVRRRMT